MKKFASDLGLDSATFDECLDSGKYTELVKTDTQFAQQIGIQSTPSTVVNGILVLGAQPIEKFEELIKSLGK